MKSDLQKVLTSNISQSHLVGFQIPTHRTPQCQTHPKPNFSCHIEWMWQEMTFSNRKCMNTWLWLVFTCHSKIYIKLRFWMLSEHWIQWGSEIRTSLDFKWSEFWMRSEIQKPRHLKSIQMGPILRHIVKKHLKFRQNIGILNGLVFKWLGL